MLFRGSPHHENSLRHISNCLRKTEIPEAMLFMNHGRGVHMLHMNTQIFSYNVCKSARMLYTPNTIKMPGKAVSCALIYESTKVRIIVNAEKIRRAFLKMICLAFFKYAADIHNEAMSLSNDMR